MRAAEGVIERGNLRAIPMSKLEGFVRLLDEHSARSGVHDE
jgi:hypothetical protein